jgi:hypothetical protein
MFSSPSYAKWEKMSKSVVGDTYYVDFGRMRKHDGFVYFWRLDDYLKPTKTGTLSNKIYNQVDCNLFRYKSLSWSFHKEPMGGGTGNLNNDPDKEWTYPSPNSVNETVLKQVCSR